MIARHIRKVWTTQVLLLLAAALGGCASTGDPPPPPPRAEAYQNATPTIQVTKPVDAAALLTTADTEAAVTITTDNGEPTSQRMTWEKTDTGWTRTITGHSIAYLWLGPDGSVVLPREDDLHEKVRVEYDPPLLVLPARLGEGEIKRVTSKVAVTVLETGAPRASGECVSTIAEIHERQIKTPAGTVNAYVVRQVRSMSLSVAKVGVVIDTSYAQVGGLVEQEYWEARKMLGLFGKQSHTKILLER